jgi:cytoskeletal protein CcmA (bactofilin family)
MGATYTRQSSSGITDGAVIEASDLNNEFDQLLAAFVASTGHTHDGTAAEGGPVTKLLGTAITIGDGTSGTDIAVTFDGESADGVLTWMEDEDYFKFSDEVLMNSTEKLLFGDTGTYIYQSADGVLDLVSDSEIEINATTIDINGAVAMDGAITGATNITLSGELDAATLDISGNADIDGTTNLDAVDIDGAVQLDAAFTVGVDDTGYDVKFFGDTASAYMLWDTSADDLVLAGAAGIDLAGDIDVDGTANLDNTDIDGTFAVDGTTISLDATTSLNIDNSNTSNGVTIATATSGVPISIGHSTSETTVNDNLTVTGNISIGGNFDVTGTIDLSDSDFTNAGDIQLDSITGDGDTNTSITFSGSDVITITAGGDTQFTFNNGSILPTTDNDIDLGSSSYQFKDAYINGTLEADAITIGGTAIGSIYGVVAGSSSIVTTGALDSGSITSGFGSIDNGTSNIRSATITAETAFVPDASGGADLGTAALEFNDAFFNDSAVINFGDDQDITLTHVADTGLTMACAHANGTNLQLNNTASDGDAAIQFALSGTVAYTMGVEDGDSDKFVINYGTGALGAQPALEISSAGAVTVPGDLTVSGTLTGAASAGFALAMAVAL